ncbi:MAG TPA: hypothetical protein VGR85_08370 [Candidatus Limnocylindria bacterium]|jgi:hypothetical protein|nr:hypothetical protein [Candidatus Limnocylindria bacterium]
MRALTALAALAVLASACMSDPSRPTDTPAPSSVTRTAPPGPVLARLSIPAKFGEQGIRVSPNGEMVLVIEREGFVHTIYDLTGRALASHKLGEIAMNPFWLPDSSGVVTGRRVGLEPNGSPLLDLSILELDGSVRELARGVSYPTYEGHQVSPDGSSFAFATPCCPSKVVAVPRNGGSAREIATAPTKLRVLSWDADGYVLYWSGVNAIDAGRGDGTGYQVPLGLPAGVNALDIEPGIRTAGGVANVFSIRADGPFPGTGQHDLADRTLIARELRPYQSGVALAGRVSGTEVLTHTIGSFGAYDVTTGVTRTLAVIADDDGTRPTALSGRIVMISPSRTWVRVFDLDRDAQWHETEVGRILNETAYVLSRGRFLVFDEDGAPYVLDGVAARAAPARAVSTATSPNETAGTIQVARNAKVGQKMQLAWRMPDGAPQSLDYFGGRLVVVSTWTRPCVVCTQQLALLSDVTVGSRVEIIAVGVDETEASALEVAKDFRRLRPLVGTRAVLQDISPSIVPQAFVLDSDHIVRQVFVGPFTWEALVRALTAASKSRLALRDGDVALS